MADALLARGWTLLARRRRTRHGELDLVALDGDTLVVVEVKYRRDGDPAEAVTPRKRARLRRAADEFAAEFGLEGRERRFDVAAVGPDGWRLIEGVDIAAADRSDRPDPDTLEDDPWR